MKIKLGAVLLPASAVLLSGCAGFWDPPALDHDDDSTPTTDSSGTIYVLDQTTSQIAAYTISSGTLDTISGSPVRCGQAPVHRHCAGQHAKRRIPLCRHCQRHLPLHHQRGRSADRRQRRQSHLF